jgi:hypothetical protein
VHSISSMGRLAGFSVAVIATFTSTSVLYQTYGLYPLELLGVEETYVPDSVKTNWEV